MRLLVIVLGAAILLLPGCSKKSDVGSKQEGAIAAKQNYSEAMTAMSKLMAPHPGEAAGQPMDFTAIEKVYRESFAGLVKAYGAGVDVEIDSAFERAKRGQDIKLQRQWIEKSLQRVIYHTALNELDKVPTDKSAIDKAADLIACTKPIIARREKWLNAGTQLQDQVDLEISKLKVATPEQVPAHISGIKNVLKKVYFLCVLYETKGLKAIRGTGDEKEIVAKYVEGLIYFNVLAPVIDDINLRNALAAEWKKAPNDIDVESIKSNLSRAVPEVWKELPDSIKNF